MVYRICLTVVAELLEIQDGGKMKQNKTKQALMILLLACTFPGSATAFDAHCVGISLNTSSPVDVYLNYDSFQYLYDSDGNFGGLTLDESIGMVLQALEEWNHSTAGRPLIYKGITTTYDGYCGVGVVRAGDFDGGGIFGPWVTDVNAQMRSKCGGSGFTIVFSTKDSLNQPKKWKTGDPALPGIDMINTMTHEFGHVLGIGHPLKANAFSVMEFQNPNRRELYQLDTECAEEYYDGHPLSLAGTQMVFSGGSFSSSLVGSSTFWSMASGVTSGGSASSPNRFRGVRMTNSGLYAEKYSSGLRYLGNINNLTSHPPSRIHRRDLPAASRDAILVKRRGTKDYGSYRHEKFYQTIYLSSDGFEANATSETLKYCSSASGSMLQTCNAVENVYSARRVAAAYDEWTGRTVYAWTDQNRENHLQNNNLLVAFGNYNANTVGLPFSAGVRSDVAPGVACKAGQAGSIGYDCMLAYTDITDSKNSVRFRRFFAYDNGSHYVPLFEAGYHQVDAAGWQRTASPIGLFYHSGKWWLAIKLALATGNGGVRFYSSTTGDEDTWTGHGSFGYTATGAGAIGDWTGSNYVQWTH